MTTLGTSVMVLMKGRLLKFISKGLWLACVRQKDWGTTVLENSWCQQTALRAVK